MTTREAFEAFISAPPFEMPIERFDDRSAWPGSYTELEVDLAWQAWQAATATAAAAAPTWHDAPTVQGVWICDEGDICYTWTAHNIEILDQFDPGDGLRWYGPIPEDGQ
jgi:hypothetical protein